MPGTGFMVDPSPVFTVTTADVYQTGSDPTVNHDAVDTAGIGQTFNEGDIWINTTTDSPFICLDDATGAAVWQAIGSGDGDVVGPAGATDNAIARYDGATGKLIQNSIPTVTDSGGIAMTSTYGLAATPTEATGLVQRNSTAATAVQDQVSPGYYSVGQAWDAGAGATSEVAWRQYGAPIAGNPPMGQYRWAVSIGGGAYSRRMEITSWGQTSLSDGTNAIELYPGFAVGFGIGAGSSIYNTTDLPLQVLSTRASGAGNISVALDADVNAVAIDAGHKAVSFGWITNLNARNELGYVTGAGGLTMTGAGVFPTGVTCTSSYLTATALGLDGALAIGTSPTEAKGLVLRNSTAAAAGAQQYSPSFFLAGQGWETGTGTSDEVIWRITNMPVQGAAASTYLAFDVSLNGAAYANKLQVNSNGSISSAAFSASGTVISPFTGTSSTDGIGVQQSDQGTGLGTTSHLIAFGATTAGYELALIHKGRTDGANNIVIASVYDAGAASITNAATMRIHSFGWTNNADAYTELAYFTAAGGAALLPTAIAATPSEGKGLVLRNSTAAVDGTQQYSPSIYLAGQGWETTGPSSDEAIWRITTVPVQGATMSADLYWDVSLNGGAYASKWIMQSDGDLLCATDGGGSIGANAANRPYDGFFSHDIKAAGMFSFDSTYGALEGADRGTGFGSTTHLLSSRNQPAGLLLTSSSRDAADAVIAFTCYDRNAAAITNADTMRIHSFGWTNNADAYTELAYFNASGGLHLLPTAILVTPTEAKGLVLRNTTAATVGDPVQYSPSIYLAGQAYKTAVATKEAVWRITNVPANAATITSELQWDRSLEGGAYANMMKLSSAGGLTTTGGYSGASFYVTGNSYCLARLQVYYTQHTFAATYNVNAMNIGKTSALAGFDDEFLFSHANRTDGASNNVYKFEYDRNAAAITNLHSMRIATFGFKDNGDVYNELFAVVANGTIYLPVAYVAATPPTGIGAGQIAYFSDGDGGNPCLGVYNGANWLRVVLGAAVSNP